MAKTDASGTLILDATQSHYHSVVGRKTNKRGEKGKREKGVEEIHEHVFEKCYIGFCTPTHTEMDYKKKKKHTACADLCQCMDDDLLRPAAAHGR